MKGRTEMTTRTIPCVVISVALLATACGNSDDAESTISPTPASTPMVQVTTTIEAATTTLSALDAATQLVDEWLAGWAAKDPDMVAGVFAEDAVYTNPTHTEEYTGTDEIRAHAVEYREFILNVRRIGDGVVTEHGDSAFMVDFDAEEKSYRGEIEVELQGDLISRMTWLHHEPAD